VAAIVTLVTVVVGLADAGVRKTFCWLLTCWWGAV
jgi:hypothetical protein